MGNVKNNGTVSRVHWSFWLFGTVALIWNVMSGINFFAQMNADLVAAMPETHRAIIEGRPAWATGAFAIAAFGGAIGSLLLLLRKTSAYYLFIASLLGVVVTMIHTLVSVGSTISDPFEIVMMVLMPIVVAAFFIWYSKHAISSGWMR